MEETILSVTTTVDELDSGADEGTGLSLREAVAIANNTAEDEIIELEANGTYELSSGELDIASTGGNLTIRGLGEGATIDANENSRVLHVNGDDNDSEAILSLGNITVTGGRTFTSVTGDSDGAGILIDNGASVILSDCNITGNAVTDSDNKGGGIFNDGILTLTNCIVSNNSAGEGGGIQTSYGLTTIFDSTITNNTVSDFIGDRDISVGGGISHRGSGSTAIENSTISDNTAGSAGGGVSMGDLSSDMGSLSIVDSTISGNTARSGAGITSRRAESATIENTVIENNIADFGGGVSVASGTDVDAVEINNSIIRNNTAYGDGGGIYADNDLTVRNSTISGNRANSDGGGIKSRYAGVAIYDSVIDSNSAGGNGGGIEDVDIIRGTTISNNSADGDGGGIASGIGVIIDSTISGNTAGGDGGGIRTIGGLYSYYVLAIANTTISGNSANGNGGGIDIVGGLDVFQELDPSEYGNFRELFNSGVVANNVTITNNIADSDNNGEGDGGGIYNPSYFDAGNASVIPGELELSNSILEGNFDTPENNGEGSINPNISGPARGNANNLVGNLEGLTIAELFVATEEDSLGQGSDLTGVDPQLSELQDNGGATQTHALLAGSPAINAGNNDYILQEIFVDVNGNGEPTTFDLNDDGDTDDALQFDQRQTDFARIFGDTVDIGALEVQNQPELTPEPTPEPEPEPTPEPSPEPSPEPTPEPEPSPEPSPEEDSLDTDIFRFQNNDVPGTYLYVTEPEAQNIRENFDNFTEEGLAFQVAVEPGDDLMPMYRFQSEDNPGTYLFVGESERDNIRENFTESFTEEGLAFYTYNADSELGTDFYRFQNTAQPGTYLFATGQERENIRENFSNFVEEGIAFSVDV